MGKRVVVRMNKFDATLLAILKSKPIPRAKIKTSKKKPAKLIAPQN